MHARLLPLLVGGCLGAVACSGSGGSADPATLPPITATPSATPTAVAVPTEATAATPEAAAAFARYFYAQVEMAYQLRDPAMIAALSAPGCSACERFIASVSRLRERNERTVGLVYRIVDAVASPMDADTARVDVIYDGPEVVRYDSSGNVVNREAAAVKAAEQVNLVRAPDGWRVQGVLKR